MTDSPNAPQPPPKLGTAVHTVDLVVADLWERKGIGIAKYTHAHQHDNDRDHLVDLYQEQLDAAVYTRAEIERREDVAKRVRWQVLTDLADWFEAETPDVAALIRQIRHTGELRGSVAPLTERLVDLARTVRDETNSAPLTELLNLIEGVRHA